MMVYVKEKAVDAVYISATSTIYNIEKGKSSSLTAMLSGTGVTVTDEQNLKWSVNDSNIIQITGIKSDGFAVGKAIYVTALQSGEAIITCTHEKAASALQFYIVVPGTEEKIPTLNKTYMTLIKGQSGSELKATIKNSTSPSDYNDLIWSTPESGKADTQQIVKIMGNGQTVNIFPVSVGTTTVTCQLPDAKTIAQCSVTVNAGNSLTFQSQKVRVQPGHSKTVKYTVSPIDATLQFMITDSDVAEFSYTRPDKDGNGELIITGGNLGNENAMSATINVVSTSSTGGSKANLAVTLSWDYSFILNDPEKTTATMIWSCSPEAPTKTWEYTVNPPDADIQITTENEYIGYVETTVEADAKTGKGTISLTPKQETDKAFTISIHATNKYNQVEFGLKNIQANFQYTEVTPRITYIGSNGVFSKYNTDSNVLTLGDGETVTLDIGIKEKRSNAVIKDVQFVTNTQYVDDENAKLISVSKGTENTWTITHSKDYTENYYYITEVRTSNQETNVNDFRWKCYCKNSEDSEIVLCPKRNSNRLLNWSQKWLNGGGRYWVDGSFKCTGKNYIGINKQPPSIWNQYFNNFKSVNNYDVLKFLNYKTVYTAEEMWNTPYFYCPGTTYSDIKNNLTFEMMQNNINHEDEGGCDGGRIHVCPHIVTELVHYSWETCRNDNGGKIYGKIGTINIILENHKRTQNQKIDLQLNISKCEKKKRNIAEAEPIPYVRIGGYVGHGGI